MTIFERFNWKKVAHNSYEKQLFGRTWRFFNSGDKWCFTYEGNNKGMCGVFTEISDIETETRLFEEIDGLIPYMIN